MLYDVCVKIKQLFLNINDNFVTSKKVLEAIRILILDCLFHSLEVVIIVYVKIIR